MKKRKVLITSLVLGISLCAGTAFAAYSSGDSLQKWYQSRIDKVTEKINNNVVSPGETKIDNQFNTLKDKLIGTSKTPIENQTTKTKFSSSLSILNYGDKYVNEIKSKKKELLGTKQKDGIIKQDFDNLVQQENQVVDNVINEAVGQAIKDMNAELDNVVNTSKATMEDSSKNAQQELASVISTSKQEVTDKLNSEQVNSLETIKNHIDSDVDSSKANIVQDTQSYVSTGIKGIQDTGKELNDKAQDELSKVILNIGK